MKVLVSTLETQGDEPSDFTWVPEGELVGRYGFVCGRERPDGEGGCGCGRSFSGFAAHQATTTAMVVERDMSEADWRAALHDTLQRSGWADHATPEALADDIDDIAEQELEELEDLPVGTVIGRRAWTEGDRIFDHILVRRLGPGITPL